jgi:putative chitinase
MSSLTDRSSLPHALTADVFCRIGGPVPSNRRGKQQVNASILHIHLPPLMALYEIERPLRLAHFLGQLAHESDAFCTFEEYASGAAYEGRADLGNTERGDGVRFKGRGPIQLTGRTNYRRFTVWLRKQLPGNVPDFEAEPHLVTSDDWVCWSAIYFWVVNDLNRLADRDNILAITRIINGGKNGLDDRKVKVGLAKAEIARLLASAETTPDAVQYPVLHRGLMNDERVEGLQYWLTKHGAPIAVDGDFGSATELALKTFQARKGLAATGISDAATWSALVGE